MLQIHEAFYVEARLLILLSAPPLQGDFLHISPGGSIRLLVPAPLSNGCGDPMHSEVLVTDLVKGLSFFRDYG